MTNPNTPLDPEKQPALVRVDAYQEWRKREGVPLVGGVYIKDMKAVEVGPWPRKGDGVNGALCYLDGDDEGDEHICRAPTGRLNGALEAYVHRGDLRRLRTRLHLGLARQGSQADF